MFCVEILEPNGNPRGKYAGDRDRIPNGTLGPAVDFEQAYKFSDKESADSFKDFMRTHYDNDFEVTEHEYADLPKCPDPPPPPKCKPPKLESNEIGDKIINYLNELKDLNSIAITALVTTVVKVGKLENAGAFVNHPHVMCGMSDEFVVVGMLGIVNGVCSVLGCGTIAAVFEDGKVNNFMWLEKYNESKGKK